MLSALGPPVAKFRALRAQTRAAQSPSVADRWWTFRSSPPEPADPPEPGAAADPRAVLAAAAGGVPNLASAADIAAWRARVWPPAQDINGDDVNALQEGVLEYLLDADLNVERLADTVRRVTATPELRAAAAAMPDLDTGDQALLIADVVRRILLDAPPALGGIPEAPLPRPPAPRTAPHAVSATSRVRIRALGTRYAVPEHDRGNAPRGDRSARLLHHPGAEADPVACATRKRTLRAAQSADLRAQLAAVVAANAVTGRRAADPASG